MLRSLLVGALALVLAACQATQASPAPSSRDLPGPSPIVASPSPSAPDPPTPSPSSVPSQGAATRFAWTPLTGLDLRGAFVATGAASAARTVLLGADIETTALLSWTSEDGTHWERHWLDGTTFGGGLPSQVVAGGPGFVATGWELSADLRLRPAIWTSTDGVRWTVDPDPSGSFGGDQTAGAATSSSIVVAWCCADNVGALSTSVDGIHWQASTPGDATSPGPFEIAAAADGFLATAFVDLAPGHGEHAFWRSRDGLAWTRDGTLERDLAQFGVGRVLEMGGGFVVVDDVGQFHAVGLDGTLSVIEAPTDEGGGFGGGGGLAWIGPVDEECLSAWIRRPDSWDLLEPASGHCLVPTESDSWSEPPYRTTALPDGWLVVGGGASAASDTAWAIRPTGVVGQVEAPAGAPPVPPTSAIPVPPTGAFPTPADCPTEPVTIKAIVGLDPRDRAACFGSRTLSFRAWVVDPGEGYGGTCPPTTPRWLHPCVLPDWLLAERKTRNANAEEEHHVIDPPKLLDALKSPGAKGDLKGVGRWVEVTGHFEDPAAATCRPTSGPAGIGLPPMAFFVLRCREQFAVTRIETTR